METESEGIQSSGTVSRAKLKEDLRVLMHDAEALLKATAGDVSEKAKEARARLAQAVERAKATCQRVEENAVAAAKATDKVIRSHPYESIGAAFGLGLLIGLFIRRK